MSLISRETDNPALQLARHYMLGSRPHSEYLHAWHPGNQPDAAGQLLVVNGSQLFTTTPELERKIETALAQGTESQLLSELGLRSTPLIDDEAPEDIPLHAISLAIAQKCNLGCTYCYAQQGDFGSAPKNMSAEIAQTAVDRLLEQTPEGGKANIAFMGGEPLVNRSTLQATTNYAQSRAKVKNITLGFSITTNGTLLTEADGDFFEAHGFAVTISLDGIGATHDRLRPYKGGQGSFDKIMARVQPLLKHQDMMQVTARVTVTPQNLTLKPVLEALLEAGFYTVGFSPMLSAPNGSSEMGVLELEIMLAEMIACGDTFEAHARQGKFYGFANLLNAMREIGKGTHRPYPCGAGAGYMGVAATGELYACHRFVDDAPGLLGDVVGGVDHERQSTWLTNRHVHKQSPCNTCWARYQCGGGCHHEAMGRGRPACDFVRGWLQYCMEVYGRLSAEPQ
ncbi:MAG: SPASM domain-containing protein [Pseudomonadales bacterium]|nr:SPASM domain-containing protein [Pseudomonadales bacterium]